MDDDLSALTREQLLVEVKRLAPASAPTATAADTSSAGTIRTCGDYCRNRSIHGSPSPPGPSSCAAASATGSLWTSSFRMRRGRPRSWTSSHRRWRASTAFSRASERAPLRAHAREVLVMIVPSPLHLLKGCFCGGGQRCAQTAQLARTMAGRFREHFPQVAGIAGSVDVLEHETTKGRVPASESRQLMDRYPTSRQHLHYSFGVAFSQESVIALWCVGPV